MFGQHSAASPLPGAGPSRKRQSSQSNDGNPKKQRPKTRDNAKVAASAPAQSKEITYRKGGLAHTLHGNVYQLKLLMLFMKRALDQKYDFNLGTEVEDAEKFDDLVLKRSLGNGKDEIRFVQVKSKQNELEKITENELLKAYDAGNNNFSLQKYFMSYCKITKNPEFNGHELKDFIIFTNIDFGDLESIQIRNITENDKILEFNKTGGTMKRCKLVVPTGHELYELLRQTSHLHQLVDTLTHQLLKKKKIQINTDMLKLYHIALRRKVFEIQIHNENDSNNVRIRRIAKFRHDFVNAHNLSHDEINFRNKLLSCLHSNKTWEDLSQTEFDISKGFGQVPADGNYKNDLPNDIIEDVEIEDFFDKLVFAVDQPNENEMGRMITDEIGQSSQFNLLNAQLVSDSFQKKMLDWFKDKRGVWLNAESGQKFLDSIEEQVHCLMSVGLSVAYPEELAQFGMTFDRNVVYENLKEFLSQTNQFKKILRVIAPEDTLLSAINVYSALEVLKGDVELTHYKSKDSYIFIRLKTMLGERTKQFVLNAFESKNSQNLLIINCESDESTSMFEVIQLCMNLSEIVKNPNKKIVLITQEHSILYEGFPIDLKVMVNDDSSFSNLTEGSKKQLLMNEVTFQGQSVCFNALIDKSDDQAADIIDAGVMTKLLKGEISINNLEQGLGEVADYYINRKFRRVVLSMEHIKSYLEETNSSQIDLIVITGVDSGLKQCNVFECEDTESSESKFFELREKNPNSNIHWLEYKSKILFWCKSYGSIENILQCRLNDEIEVSTAFLDEEEFTHKGCHDIIVISDPAGMGKSTVLTHLTMQLQRGLVGTWVTRINLNDHTTVLKKALNNEKKKLRDPNCDENVDLVNDVLASKMQSKIEKDLFHCNFNKNEKMAFLLDGFDEICPEYKDIALSLLQELKNKKEYKIFVTTRPNVRNELERSLNTFSHVLRPLSKLEQTEFLTRFWTKKLELDDTDTTCKTRLNLYVSSVIEYVSKSTNNYHQDFVGIPLQTMMIAEVFQEHFELATWQGCNEFLLSKVDKPQLPNDYALLDLYGQFVEMKYFRFHLEDKKRRDLTISGEEKVARKELQLFKDKCAILALKAIFDEVTIENLLSRREIEELNGLIEEFRNNEHNEGIIDQFVDDKPQFIHRTFAEYFVSFAIAKKMLVAPATILQCIEGVLPNMSPIFISSLVELLAGEQETLSTVLKKPLLLFIITGHYPNFIKSLLKYDLSDWPKKLDAFGKTPLHYAIEHDHLDIALRLLEYSNDIYEKCILKHGNFKNPDYGNSKLVKFVNTRDNFGNTALYYALEHGYINLAFELLLKGASIDLLSDEKVDILIEHMLCTQRNSNIYNNSILAAYADQDNKYRPIEEKLFLRRPNLFSTLSLKDQSRILSYFFVHGRIKVIDALLATINDLDKRMVVLQNPDNNTTPLDRVNNSNHLNDSERSQIIQYLLERGCTITSGAHTTNYVTNILEVAAKNGAMTTFQQLIDREVSDNYVLHFRTACYYNRHNIVKYLLENHEDKLLTDGNTVLHTVCDSNANLKIIKYLIDNRNDINATNDKGETPLFMAIYKRSRVNVMEYLVSKEAKVNFEDKFGNTALSRALESDQCDIVRYLLKNGARVSEKAAPLTKRKVAYFKDPDQFNLDRIDDNGCSRLHNAIHEDDMEWIKFLVRQGADVNKVDAGGKTPMHWACAVGNAAVVELLLQYGAMFDVKDCHNKTPRDLLVRNANSKIDWLFHVLEKLFNSDNFWDNFYKELLDDNSRNKLVDWGPYGMGIPDAWDGDNPVYIILNARNHKGSTLLHLAATETDRNAISTILNFNKEYLKKDNRIEKYYDYQPMSIEIRDADGYVPLHVAARRGRYSILSFLLQKGAIFNSKSVLRETAETLAIDNGHKSIVDLLEQVKNMFIAVVKNNILDIVNSLKEKQLSTYINVKNESGQTLLHLAALHGNAEVAQLLLDNFPHISAVDLNKDTLLHAAVQSSDVTIVKLLLTYGAPYNMTNVNRKRPFDLIQDNNQDLLKTVGHIDSLFKDIQSDNPEIIINNLQKMSKGFNIVIKTFINARDDLGNTLLHYATEICEYDIVRFLLENGACYDAKNNKGVSPDSVSDYQTINDLFKLIDDMFDNVNNIYQQRINNMKLVANVRNSKRKGLLHYVSRQCRLELVKVLVEGGAAVDLTDVDYCLANEDAVKLEMLKYLIDNGDVHTTNYMGETPLLLAVKANSTLDVIKYLANKGSDVDRGDLLGGTPLSRAEDDRLEDIRAFLLSRGARVRTGL